MEIKLQNKSQKIYKVLHRTDNPVYMIPPAARGDFIKTMTKNRKIKRKGEQIEKGAITRKHLNVYCSKQHQHKKKGDKKV